MLRLTGADAKKIDSSQETLDKWYEFLDNGARNIGFGPNVYEHLHDNYDAGLPAVGGGLVSLDDSGRAIFRRSIADKALTHWVLSCSGKELEHCVTHYGIHNDLDQLPDAIRAYLLIYDLVNWAIRADEMTIDHLTELLPDVPQADIEELIEFVKDLSSPRRNNSPYEQNFRTIVSRIYMREDTEVILFMINPVRTSDTTSWSPGDDAARHLHRTYAMPYILSDRAKEIITSYIEDEVSTDGNTIVQTLHNAKIMCDDEQQLPYREREMVFKMKNKYVQSSIVDIGYFDNFYSKNFKHNDLQYCRGRQTSESYGQLVNEEYFIVSLNPIDKLMCSTKQSFGSCLSLAKEGENSGASSMGATNGLGLFATMPSDAMYLTFMTNGKHKNMYWEEEEWKKQPEKRDKDKAYKYFKMTMRQLTYKTLPAFSLNVAYNKNDLKKEATYSQHRMYENVFLNPRLQPGRLYSVFGETEQFEIVSAYLLHKAGIQSNISGYRDLVQLYDEDIIRRTVETFHFPAIFCYGKLVKPDVVWWDNYAKRRGIYFDNVTFVFKDHSERTADAPCANEGWVKTGAYRSGSHGVTEAVTDCNLDSFKFLRGVQNYTFFNKNIKICNHCGKMIDGSDALNLQDGNVVCKTCADELGYQQCKYCREWYTEEDAHKHAEIDLAKYFIKGLSNTTKITCLNRIKYARTDMIGQEHQRSSYNSSSRGFICGSCGEIHYLSSWEYNHDRHQHYFYTQEIEGQEYRFRICGSCLNHCVICDCCHEIINMKNSANPVLLMPGNKTRVVCRDCAENIRMKKSEKEMLTQAIDATQYVLSTGDYDEAYAEAGRARINATMQSDDAQQFLADLAELINKQRTRNDGYGMNGLLKNINQQIQGMTGRNGKGYPKPKSDKERIASILRHSLVEYTLDIIKASAAEGENDDTEQSAGN